MIKFEITPFVGAGVIRFGMTSQEVQQLSLGAMSSFRRNLLEPLQSDQFEEFNLVVSYKLSGVVETVEFGKDANLQYAGVKLFDQTVEQLKTLLLTYDPNLEVDCDGFVAHEIGIGAYVLGADDEDGSPAELISIIVFEKGYYD
jgi:hypothetical protein